MEYICDSVGVDGIYENISAKPQYFRWFSLILDIELSPKSSWVSGPRIDLLKVLIGDSRGNSLNCKHSPSDT
jgi:hypothetical protein